MSRIKQRGGNLATSSLMCRGSSAEGVLVTGPHQTASIDPNFSREIGVRMEQRGERDGPLKESIEKGARLKLLP